MMLKFWLFWKTWDSIKQDWKWFLSRKKRRKLWVNGFGILLSVARPQIHFRRANEQRDTTVKPQHHVPESALRITLLELFACELITDRN